MSMTACIINWLYPLKEYVFSIIYTKNQVGTLTLIVFIQVLKMLCFTSDKNTVLQDIICNRPSDG